MITVLAENAYKAARKVKPLANHKHLPVLNCIALFEHEGRLAMLANNLEDSAVEYCPARVDRHLETCVPARAFTDWLRIAAKSKDVLELEHDPKSQILTVKTCPEHVERVRGDWKTVKSEGQSKATFKCIDYGEFPPMRTK